MVRQPYSVAVPSTGGRLHPRFLRVLSPGNGGTEGGVKTIERGLGRKWSSPCRRDGEVEKAFFNGKEGRDDFRKLFLIFKNTKIKPHYHDE